MRENLVEASVSRLLYRQGRLNFVEKHALFSFFLEY